MTGHYTQKKSATSSQPPKLCDTNLSITIILPSLVMLRSHWPSCCHIDTLTSTSLPISPCFGNSTFANVAAWNIPLPLAPGNFLVIQVWVQPSSLHRSHPFKVDCPAALTSLSSPSHTQHLANIFLCTCQFCLLPSVQWEYALPKSRTSSLWLSSPFPVPRTVHKHLAVMLMLYKWKFEFKKEQVG